MKLFIINPNTVHHVKHTFEVLLTIEIVLGCHSWRVVWLVSRRCEQTVSMHKSLLIRLQHKIGNYKRQET